MTEERIKMIKHDLSSLEPLKINIEDEGHLHVGHAGAKSGGILSYTSYQSFLTI